MNTIKCLMRNIYKNVTYMFPMGYINKILTMSFRCSILKKSLNHSEFFNTQPIKIVQFHSDKIIEKLYIKKERQKIYHTEPFILFFKRDLLICQLSIIPNRRSITKMIQKIIRDNRNMRKRNPDYREELIVFDLKNSIELNVKYNMIDRHKIFLS